MSVLDQMIENARTALAEFEPYTQEQVDACVKAACLAVKAHAEELARETIEETGLGDLAAKIEKNAGSPDGIWYDLKGKKALDKNTGHNYKYDRYNEYPYSGALQHGFVLFSIQDCLYSFYQFCSGAC